MANSEMLFAQESVTPTPGEVDGLLAQVSDQIAQNRFDPSQQPLLKQLVESFGDSRGMTRLRVAETLGQIGQPATSVLEAALLRHHNPVVRRASAKTLTLIADPTSIPTLLQALLNDEDTVVKGSSVAALAKMGEAAVPELLTILESPNHSPSTHGHAAWALAFIGTEALPYLQQALTSDSAEVRAAVVGAIAKVAPEKPEAELEDILIRALDDRAEMVRCEAAVALGDLAHQPALSALIPLLTHSDWETRKSAALALMKIGSLEAINPLQTARQQEPEPAVQKVLELAISQLQRKQ